MFEEGLVAATAEFKNSFVRRVLDSLDGLVALLADLEAQTLPVRGE